MSPLCFSAPLPLNFSSSHSYALSPTKPPSHSLPTPLPYPSPAHIPPHASTTICENDGTPSATDISTAPIFMCPNCKTDIPLGMSSDMEEFPKSCPHCSAPFLHRDGYIDLTTEENTPENTVRLLLEQISPDNFKQNLFRVPAVSRLYERGWRDMFKRAGFPGPEKEMDMFLDFAAPARTVLDLSCGSGILTRPIAKSGEFQRVIAADYSDSMLRETVAQARNDITVPEFDVVRGNVLSLPFADGAFDVVHAGAAIHCYPKLQDALAEICRVIKPGGKFFATTFFKGAYGPTEAPFGSEELLEIYKRLFTVDLPPSGFRFFDEDELVWLFKCARFDVRVERVKNMAVIRAEKKVI